MAGTGHTVISGSISVAGISAGRDEDTLMLKLAPLPVPHELAGTTLRVPLLEPTFTETVVVPAPESICQSAAGRVQI